MPSEINSLTLSMTLEHVLVPDVHVSKKIKRENPFPNWKPITKISYIELDIIVSRLVP